MYFITFTSHNWFPLIDIANAYHDVYNFFSVLKQKGNEIVGYVIMPNHIHFLLHYTSVNQTLNTLIGNGKRFMAYSIIKRLQEQGSDKLLQTLQNAVEPKDRSRGKQHEVWKVGFDVKPCRTGKFLLQKLNYIHDNPIKEKWKLAKEREDYIHSSCQYYFSRVQRLCHVKHYEEVLDWENMYLDPGEPASPSA